MRRAVLNRVELADRLTDALGHLRVADEATGYSDRDRALARFMEDLDEIGRAVTAMPEARDDADVALFLHESGLLLNGNLVLVERHARRTEELLLHAWEVGVEWEAAAARRSALAFLDELYAGTAYEGFVATMELDELDRLLRLRTLEEGPPLTEAAPEGIPRSHWWWWPIAADDDVSER